MNCKDCKHWGTGEAQRQWDEEHTERSRYDPEDTAPAPAQRICSAVTLLQDGNRHDFDAPLEERRVRLAYLIDASSYRADMWTAPEFGCVLFDSPQPAQLPSDP